MTDSKQAIPGKLTLFNAICFILLLSSCDYKKKEENIRSKEAALNQKEQELLLKEKTLQLKEEDLVKREKRLDYRPILLVV